MSTLLTIIIIIETWEGLGCGHRRHRRSYLSTESDDETLRPVL